ncbi:MAG: BPL-N domain-containing protein [Candidatus Thorarchaeota archaeon]
MKKSVIVSLVIIMFFTMVSTPTTIVAEFTPSQDNGCQDLTGFNVAIYNDRGTEHWPSGWISLNAMFSWMNATIQYVNVTEIQEGILSNFDIVAFPGGSASTYRLALNEDGMDEIRSFVNNGGSYFGICGGSLFGTAGRLGLFDGSYISPVPGVPDGAYLMNMTVNRESTGPDLSDEPANYSTLYWSSSYFESENMSDIIPIMQYPGTNYSSMIAFNYGNGSVFLSSPHPELEEGDNRDGSSAFDYLDDPDSEWGLLLKVSYWLVYSTLPPPEPTESLLTTTTTSTDVTTTQSTTTTSENVQETFDIVLVSLISVGVLGIVVIAILIRKR